MTDLVSRIKQGAENYFLGTKTRKRFKQQEYFWEKTSQKYNESKIPQRLLNIVEKGILATHHTINISEIGFLSYAIVNRDVSSLKYIIVA